MGRKPILWSKKRGRRQTGAPWVGPVGEVLFYAALVILGTMLLASVVSAQIVYSSAERPFYSAPALLLWVVVSLLMLAIGGRGLVQSALQVSVSAERRLALIRRATGRDKPADDERVQAVFPGVPRDARLTDSPGMRLAYRLPMVHTSAWRLAVIAVLWVGCVGAACVLSVWAMENAQADGWDWYRVVPAVLFIALAIAASWWFVTTLLKYTGIGPTIVEISRHPLYPGGRCQVFLAQIGHARFRRLQLRLVCEEEATYRQGTNLQTDVMRVCDQLLWEAEDVAITPASPLEIEVQLTVPEGAMHSFQSLSNAVYWKLVVHGQSPGWPVLERAFPVVVYPRDPHDTDVEQPEQTAKPA